MYHDDTQYFGEDYAKGPDSTAIALIEGNKIHEAFDSEFVKYCKPEFTIAASTLEAISRSVHDLKHGFSVFITPRHHGKASFHQQFGERKPTYFDRVPANTRLAKSTVFKRMQDLSQIR